MAITATATNAAISLAGKGTFRWKDSLVAASTAQIMSTEKAHDFTGGKLDAQTGNLNFGYVVSSNTINEKIRSLVFDEDFKFTNVAINSLGDVGEHGKQVYLEQLQVDRAKQAELLKREQRDRNLYASIGYEPGVIIDTGAGSMLGGVLGDQFDDDMRTQLRFEQAEQWQANSETSILGKDENGWLNIASTGRPTNFTEEDIDLSSEEAMAQVRYHSGKVVYGDKGFNVRRLQTALNDLGAGLKVDGAFGKNTAAALSSRGFEVPQRVQSTPVFQSSGSKKKIDYSLPYADMLNKTAERTGVDSLLLKTIINAENRTWDVNIVNSDSGAMGLGQFTSGTWKGLSKMKGSALYEHIQNSKKNGNILSERNILALRGDARLSIDSIADLANDNLRILSQSYDISGLSYWEKNKMIYLAHHEGMGKNGLVSVIEDKLGEQKSLSRLNVQLGNSKAAVNSLIKSNSGDASKAYRKWLFAYTDKHIQPSFSQLTIYPKPRTTQDVVNGLLMQ